MTTRRPRVALVATSWFENSHADVIGRRLIEGYRWEGRQVGSRLRVVSVHVEQDGLGGAAPRPDLSRSLTDRNSIPRYSTVAEAIGAGQPGVGVDGVVIVGEHGDYELNEFGQKTYPRRRLVEAAVSTMIGAGRVVPIFSDKHLAWSQTDAQAVYDTVRRLGIPLLAGSSLPLTWRRPTGVEWPLGAPMRSAVGICYGSTEAYGFHALEAVQAFAERRAGGESGVRSVRALRDDAAVGALTDGTVDADLAARALATIDASPEVAEAARRGVRDVFLVEHLDGLRTAVLNYDGVVSGFAVAAQGEREQVAAQMWLEDGGEFGHFTFLVRQIEALMIRRRAPYPVERTLLTTGVLAAAMRARSTGEEQRTPELAIRYQAPPSVPDTGVGRPLPDLEP